MAQRKAGVEPWVRGWAYGQGERCRKDERAMDKQLANCFSKGKYGFTDSIQDTRSGTRVKATIRVYWCLDLFWLDIGLGKGKKGKKKQ